MSLPAPTAVCCSQGSKAKIRALLAGRRTDRGGVRIAVSHYWAPWREFSQKVIFIRVVWSRLSVLEWMTRGVVSRLQRVPPSCSGLLLFHAPRLLHFYYKESWPLISCAVSVRPTLPPRAPPRVTRRQAEIERTLELNRR